MDVGHHLKTTSYHWWLHLQFANCNGKVLQHKIHHKKRNLHHRVKLRTDYMLKAVSNPNANVQTADDLYSLLMSTSRKLAVQVAYCHFKLNPNARCARCSFLAMRILHV